MNDSDRALRSGRCPDDGYCHDLEPCDPLAACARVGSSGPLSGVFSGDTWPSEIVEAHRIVHEAEQYEPEPPTDDQIREEEAQVRGDG